MVESSFRLLQEVLLLFKLVLVGVVGVGKRVDDVTIEFVLLLLLLL